MSTYWPGTNIIKSQNNAFTEWKKGDSILKGDTTHIRSANGTRSRQMSDPFPANMKIYKEKK